MTTIGRGLLVTVVHVTVNVSVTVVLQNGPHSRPTTQDIPESVMEASAAAARAMTLLSGARGSLTREKTYPPEMDLTGQEPRVGVFICH